MNLNADLHTHTNYSDGVLTPKELLAKAESVGINVLSITDHDTFEGYLDALQYENEYKIKLISGCEFSTLFGNKEYHLLAYNFKTNNSELNTIVSNYREMRLKRAEAIHQKLYKLGYKFDFEILFEKFPNSQITRPHFAEILTELEYVATKKDAFDTLLYDGGPADHPKDAFQMEYVIKKIHLAGGIAILAHPGKYTALKTIYEMLHIGLDGIEVVHPMHNEITQRNLKHFARAHWLIMTGGSDFHGFREYDTFTFGKYLAPELDFVKIPAELFV